MIVPIPFTLLVTNVMYFYLVTFLSTFQQTAIPLLPCLFVAVMILSQRVLGVPTVRCLNVLWNQYTPVVRHCLRESYRSLAWRYIWV